MLCFPPRSKFIDYFFLTVLMFFKKISSGLKLFVFSYLTQLLYLDSLDVDEPIPSLIPRVSVWNSDLIAKVIKKDRKAPGEYGNLLVSSFSLVLSNNAIFCFKRYKVRQIYLL